MLGQELDCTGAGADASFCFWLTEKEKGGEVEQQAVIAQEVESETVVQPKPEPSEDLEGLGLPVTLGRCEIKGSGLQIFHFSHGVLSPNNSLWRMHVPRWNKIKAQLLGGIGMSLTWRGGSNVSTWPCDPPVHAPAWEGEGGWNPRQEASPGLIL